MSDGKSSLLFFFIVRFLLMAYNGRADTDSIDKLVLEAIKSSVSDPNSNLQWSTDDPCGSPMWSHIQCSGSSVTGLQFGKLGLRGRLPPNLNQLKNLRTIALLGNSFSGPLPTFNGLSLLEEAFLDSNMFDSIPSDFFHGLTKLTLITLDHNPLNATLGWSLSDDLNTSTSLAYLSLTNTSLTGILPSFLGQIPTLQVLHLAYNRLSGSIPSSFTNANFVILQLNNQKGQPSLSGSIEMVGTLQSLSKLWLQGNQFSDKIPESLGSLVSLKDCRLNDNQIVGPIPSSFNSSLSLAFFSVNNNNLDGSVPKIASITDPKNYTFGGKNYFCVQQVGVNCASQVNALLSFLEGIGYPIDLVQSWSGNDPCASWTGISCDPAGKNVIAINLPSRNLNGTISPGLGSLSSLRSLILSENNLKGPIPSTLASLESFQKIDVRDNNLNGPVPSFSSQVTLLDAGNPNINQTYSASPPPGSPPGSPTKGITPGNGGSNTGSSTVPQNTSDSENGSEKRKSSVSAGAVVGAVLGALVFLLVGGVIAIIMFKKKRQQFLRVQSPNTIVVRSSDSRGHGGEALKITVGNSIRNSIISDANSEGSGLRDAQVVDAGNLVISIQVLRDVTNNFSQANVLGRGGFGVVYKGELDDGTKIAVKRMEASVVSSKALNEFQAEIAVLTKVRHRNLVSLLGYCIDGNERLLVYEYMPLGPLSQHLFDWRKLCLPYLSWKRRLGIALDVARGMEYLHGLAHKSFIHRDLKPSNILLGDDYRAKVSDFGLVKLAPEGKFSIETRLAGTFGYLAPEYAVTGRVTTKSDVFSFGVVLMELITGRRALDETQPEESMHLVTSFRRTSANKDTLLKNVDEALEITDETFWNICTVAELAKHCTAREPYQRPDMGHVVNVLSSLVEQWKPTDVDWEESEGIDLELTLPQALKKWQAFEGSSATSDVDSSRVSLPTRPTGFAESFTSTDGR